jgi:hypothetical protein
MTMKLLIKKLHLEDMEFVTSEIIKTYCVPLNLDPKRAIQYLLKKGYLIRIFKRVYYMRAFDEIKLGGSKYNHLELTSSGMELKGVKKLVFRAVHCFKIE